MDYEKFYNLEDYLLKDVRNTFEKNGLLDAFDFFCIIIWKANRAKSKIAKKILRIAKTNNLNTAVKLLTKDINKEKNNKEKLRILLEKWEFGLPMGSAVLTILYPNDYTVYDIRVCTILNKYFNLNNKKIDEKIGGYFEYLEDVKERSKKLVLREKDRELWGKSFYNGLKRDIENNFKK